MWYKDGNTFNSQQAIRLDNKQVSLPANLVDAAIEAMGYLKVIDGVKPIPSAVQYVVEDVIDATGGVPIQTYVLRDMFNDTAEYTNIDGIVVPAKTKLEYETEYIAKLQADAVNDMIQHFTDMTDTYIASKIEAYNASTGMKFKDIDAFTKYAVINSKHKNVAIKFITYADSVWDAVDTYKATLKAAPTDEEFQAVLDSVVF